MTSAYPDIEGQLYTSGAPDGTYTEAEARQRAASHREVKGLVGTEVAAAVAPFQSQVSALSSRVDKTLTDAKAYTDEQVAGFDPLPAGGTAGQVLTRTGAGSAWQDSPTGLPAGGSTGQVLTTGPDGTAVWAEGTPGPAGADWSKDQQAKAQGYWIVVSPTEPESGTYTTADGTVVPVIWQKPVEQVVPVAPEEPFWGKGDSTITVAKLVGVDYKITAFIKDGVSTPANVVIPEAQAFKLSTATGAPAFPFSVKIDAVAEPGYRLLGPASWTVQYLDPDGITTMTSDGFSGTDMATIINRPTDVYAGGTAKTWMRLKGGITPAPEYAIKSNALYVDPALGSTSFNEAFLNVGTDKQHVAFDLTWDTADTNPLGFTVGLRNPSDATLGGTRFSFMPTWVSYRAPGQNADQSAFSAPSGSKLPNGRYVLEAFGETVAVTGPGGTRQIFTVPEADSTTVGNYFYLRVNGNTGAAFTLDNLVISTVGV